MKHYRAIVVGGGAAGLAAAWGLQSVGVESLCLASDKPPALLAAAGMLLPALDDFSPAVQLAADWSYDAWPDFGQRLGLQGSSHACGVVHYEGQTPTQIQTFQGRVVNTHDLYAACLGKLPHVVRVPVVACTREQEIIYVTDATDTRYSCDWLLLATGYSDQLPRCTGFQLPSDQLPRSVRGITVRCQNVSLDSILYWKKDARTVVYLAPWSDGSVVVGSTITLDDTNLQWRIEEEDMLMAMARELWPAMAQGVVVERRVGLRPLCHNREVGYRSLGGTGARNVWWLNGLFRNGILWMPACAELAANLYQKSQGPSALDGLIHHDARLAAV